MPSAMLRRLTGGASGVGGIARMSQRATSDTPYVAASIAYAVETPAAAMMTPASAGPAIDPSVP
jgi:hypothetical protein